MDRVALFDIIDMYMHIVVTVNAVLQICRDKCNIRRWWTKPHLQSSVRDKYGAHDTIFVYFKLHDHEEFRRFVGMTVEQFDKILTLVRPKQVKRSRRRSLEPELRLAATLHFLVHGNTAQQTAWMFLIGRSTMYSIIIEVCTALCEVLKHKYISFPSAEDLMVISDMFWKVWHMPNCVGSIDGKHIRIKAPSNSGSYFFNHKKYFSIVLMGLCDAFCRFTWVNIGDFGSSNDAGIFQRSDLGQALNNELVDLPEPSNLPGTDITLPYFIIGDGAFPLKNYLMKPYTRVNNLSPEEEIFNYRLSRARLTIERAFGILTKRWRILEHPLDWKVDNLEIVIMSIICLHNFLITDEIHLDDVNKKYKQQPYEILTPEEEIGLYFRDNVRDNAANMRDALKDYFNSPYRQVLWQYQRAQQ